MNLSGLWDQLVDCICRPPRDHYVIEELAGKAAGRLTFAGQLFKREDLVLVNKKNQKLQCSHYRPEKPLYSTPLPIVVYCHCNSGSRRDAEEALCVLLPQGISVFCLDFAGSGRSEGDWVTLGAHEVDDLEVVIKHLRTKFPDSAVALWGRSMGAVTCLLYGHRDPSIAGMVVDSPFARLTELMLELCEEQRIPIPRAFMRVALSMMRRSVKKRAQFSLDDVAPLDLAPKAFIPALFGHAEKDTFISANHTRRLHEAYAGDKELVIFDGDHNTVRPQHFYSSVLMFLHAALRCAQPSLPPPRAVCVTPRPVHPKREIGPLPCRAPSVRRGMVDVAPEDFLVGQTPERNIQPPWDRAGADETFKQLHSTLSWENVRRGQAGSQSASAASVTPRHSRNSSSLSTTGGRLAMEQPATSSAAATAPLDRQPSTSAAMSARLAMEQVTRQGSDSAAAAADRKLQAPGVTSSEGSAWLRGENMDTRQPVHEYDFDDEDAMLAHVLEMSMKEAQIAQRGSGVATAHAGQDSASAHRVHVHEAMQRLNSEDADELMMVAKVAGSHLP
ncbi:hypothetical protein WJX73_002562 [Symbiochloris irregularis]|uniref:Serine aminopeptidase S33 domain-containing protein n=1 Tax=Symbiochloris irregularis TaxID=706552 RepID=A0AAW1NN09_9CHLO